MDTDGHTVLCLHPANLVVFFCMCTVSESLAHFSRWNTIYMYICSYNKSVTFTLHKCICSDVSKGKECPHRSGIANRDVQVSRQAVGQAVRQAAITIRTKRCCCIGRDSGNSSAIPAVLLVTGQETSDRTDGDRDRRNFNIN